MAKQNATFDKQKDYSTSWLETFRPDERYRHMLQLLGTSVSMHTYVQTHTNTYMTENFTDHNTTISLIVTDVNVSETT
jgi:hypothetical protein